MHAYPRQHRGLGSEPVVSSATYRLGRRIDKVTPNSAKTARRTWYALSGLCFLEMAGLMTIAPSWDGGAMLGEIHALAFVVAGLGVMFMLLAVTVPGTTLSTKLNRYLFAVTGGLAFNVVVTWGLWAAGYPVTNGTIRRGLMGSNYWLGPAILAYSVIAWLFYRGSLAKETR